MAKRATSRSMSALAKACQVPQALEAANGAIIRLAPGPAEIVAAVPSGRLGLDGKALVRLDGDMIRHRHRMSFNGLIMVSRGAGQGRQAAGAAAGQPGRPAGWRRAGASRRPRPMSEAVDDALDGLSRDQLRDDEELTEICRLAARRWFHKAYDKKPVTKVHVVRL